MGINSSKAVTPPSDGVSVKPTEPNGGNPPPKTNGWFNWDSSTVQPAQDAKVEEGEKLPFLQKVKDFASCCWENTKAGFYWVGSKAYNIVFDFWNKLKGLCSYCGSFLRKNTESPKEGEKV